MWPRPHEQNFVSPTHGFHIKFGFDSPSCFWEEYVRRVWTTDDGRRRTDDGACTYYKLTYEPKGSGELTKTTTIKTITSTTTNNKSLLLDGFENIQIYIYNDHVSIYEILYLSPS